MSFLGRPNISGSVLVWDGDKLLSDKKVINLQHAYENERFIQLADTICLIGDPLISEPKLDLVHNSPFEDDEGLRLTTDPNASATSWKGIAGYDRNSRKVFEVELDTNTSYVAVTSNNPDGNSGYQFINELGTFLALDTTSSPTSLRIQKADNGYIDFGGNTVTDPILRINTTAYASSVNVGTYGSTKILNVNGMDITPYSGSLIVPIGSLDNHTLLNLFAKLENDQYATFNIDIFASTIEIPSYDVVATGTWKLLVSMFRHNNNVTVTGVTELDMQHHAGTQASDIPSSWNVDVSSNGLLFVNAKGSQYKVAFGAVITKLSVLDVFTGNVIK
jgi:hypothetical protein